MRRGKRRPGTERDRVREGRSTGVHLITHADEFRLVPYPPMKGLAGKKKP
jgi:hypothetical protein